ncbi:hypothetical protein [Paludibaculum fermentans]|uniref:hypothetical protein n=1 Tax=Paludibaculum fermentans TaxID=1473598 RepID=UPI001E597BAC|nr:hypothetical protein [Paludibaculum fermentans]
MGRRIPFNNFQPFQALERVLERSRVAGEEMEVQEEAGSGLEGGAVQVVAAQGEGARTVAQATGSLGRGRTEELFGELKAEGAAEAVGGGGGKPEKPAGAKRKAAGQDIEIHACRHEDYRTRYRAMTTYGRT